MDPQVFSKNLKTQAALYIAKLFDLSDLPRIRINDITHGFTQFLNNSPIKLLFLQLIHRLEHLNESPNNLLAIRTMLAAVLNPFEGLSSEHQCLQYFQNTQTYIPPIEVSVATQQHYKHTKDDIRSKTENITVQVIPLRQVLKKFFELPKIFDDTMSYIKTLESEQILCSNLIQGLKWKEKKKQFGDKIVFPLLFYQDDYETNNPLGSRKGLGKLGTVYIIIPCLPPSLRSKVENIFLLSLYKCEDLQYVTLKTMLSTAVAELKFLESTGIQIHTSSGQKQIFFSLAGVIRDNLAVHTILGFVGSFSSHHPCRFCLINRTEINNTFDESQCILRTDENYDCDLLKNNPSETGVSKPSVLNDIKSSTTIDLLTVDVMHDILEGIVEYDLGLILNHFIKNAKYLSLDDLNDRIESLYYGPDEIRNKPRKIKKNQIAEKYLKVSAAEALCIIRDIGVLIGHFIPVNDPHWKLCIYLKEIIDIVTSPVTHNDLSDYLGRIVSGYLRLLATLFPNCLKPKHHFLIHYARIMRLMGPLWNLNTMRAESKNEEAKVAARSAISRRNICKTVAVKHQLHLSYRFTLNHQNERNHECELSDVTLIEDLPQYLSYRQYLPENITVKVYEIQLLKFRARSIKNNAILMIPTETGPKFLLVFIICKDFHEQLFIVSKDITNYCNFDEHYQAYEIHPSAFDDIPEWKIIRSDYLESCSVAHITEAGNKKKYTVKRWV